MYWCHFHIRCKYQYSSTESFIQCIQVTSSTEEHKQNLNTRAFNAQPKCISQYHSFINKNETAAALTEDWGELVDISVTVKAHICCLPSVFPTNNSIVFNQFHVFYLPRPTYEPYEFHITQSTSHPPSKNGMTCVTGPRVILHKLLRTPVNKVTNKVRQSKQITTLPLTKRHALAQLVEALRYKTEGRAFDSRRCHTNFSST